MIEVVMRESDPEVGVLLTQLRRLSEHPNFVVQCRRYPGKTVQSDLCALLSHLYVTSWNRATWYMSGPEYARLTVVNEERKDGSPSMLGVDPSRTVETLLGCAINVVNGMESDRISIYLLDKNMLEFWGLKPYKTDKDGFITTIAVGLLRE